MHGAALKRFGGTVQGALFSTRSTTVRSTLPRSSARWRFWYIVSPAPTAQMQTNTSAQRIHGLRRSGYEESTSGWSELAIRALRRGS